MNKVLSVKDLTKEYKDIKALNKVTFDLYDSEIVGLIGPNGAGKSTLMKCITTLIFPTSGSVEVLGYDLSKQREECLKHISAQIENPALYLELSGLANLEIFASLKQARKKDIDDVIEFMNISSYINKKVSEYSLGMKQRLSIAITLLSCPKILILDEPTNGLDYNGVMEMRDILVKLKKEKNVTILISSHYLSEIEKITDRIIWIDKGKLIDAIDNEIKQSYYITVDRFLPKKLIDDYQLTESHPQLKQYYYVASDTNNLSNLLNELIGQGIKVIDIEKIEESLENKYLEIIGDK